MSEDYKKVEELNFLIIKGLGLEKGKKAKKIERELCAGESVGREAGRSSAAAVPRNSPRKPRRRSATRP